MDSDNYAAVQKICGQNWQPAKVSRILDVLYPGEQRNVPDPYYGTEKDFEDVYQLLDRACQKIVDNYLQGKG